MRISVIWFLLPVIILVSGCSSSPTGDLPGSQKYFFEVQYLNQAWGYRHLGVVVDRDGKVTGWDRSGNPWPPVQETAWTTEELEAKYTAHPVDLGTVPRAELEPLIRLIDDAQEGTVTEPEQLCADAGGSEFEALVYDAGSDTYRSVLLRLEGDYYQENLSTAARTLYAWLDELTDRQFANCPR